MLQPRRSLALALLLSTLLLSTLLLSACLVRVAYNHADWLLVWQLDSSFDLTGAQKEFLSTRLREQLRWHRETELDNTIAFLKHTQDMAANGVTISDLEEAMAGFAALRNSLANHVADDVADFFAQVSDEQLDYLQKSLTKANRDLEKRVKLPPAERSAERTERVLKIVTDWTGPLNGTQAKQLSLSIEHLPDVLEIWLTRTKQRQQQLVEIARSARTDRVASSRAFVTWISAQTEPPELNSHRAAVYELIREIDALCTQKQHAHFQRKLQDWIDDLQQARMQGAA